MNKQDLGVDPPDVAHIESLKGRTQRNVASAVMRINSSLQDPDLYTNFADLRLALRTLYLKCGELIPLEEKLRKSEEAKDRIEELRLRSEISSKKHAIADLASRCHSAIPERYAGLELRPETIAHNPDPYLCDIQRIISATALLPNFLISKFTKSCPSIFKKPERWEGFVHISNKSDPKFSPNQVISIPDRVFRTPIMVLTLLPHETGHAALFTLVARLHKNGELDEPNAYELLRKLIATNKAKYTEGELIQELPAILSKVTDLFATWFECRFGFSSNANLFVKSSIWYFLRNESFWHTDNQNILRMRCDYFYRVFYVYLFQRVRSSEVKIEIKNASIFRKFVEDKFNEFDALLNNCFPGGDSWLSSLSWKEAKKRLVGDLSKGVKKSDENALRNSCLQSATSRMLLFEKFESFLEVDELAGEPTDQYLISQEKYLTSIIEGNVVREIVSDPMRLHCRLLEKLFENNGESGAPMLCTQIAYLLTLEHTYKSNLFKELEL